MTRLQTMLLIVLGASVAGILIGMGVSTLIVNADYPPAPIQYSAPVSVSIFSFKLSDITSPTSTAAEMQLPENNVFGLLCQRTNGILRGREIASKSGTLRIGSHVSAIVTLFCITKN